MVVDGTAAHAGLLGDMTDIDITTFTQQDREDLDLRMRAEELCEGGVRGVRLHIGIGRWTHGWTREIHTARSL